MDGGRAREAEALPVRGVVCSSYRSSYALCMARPIILVLLVVYICKVLTAGAACCPNSSSGAS